MKTIIITGKQCCGKRTLANHIAYSLKFQHVYKVAVTDETDLFGQIDSYYYSEVQNEVFDDDIGDVVFVAGTQKELLGSYGFEKSAFEDGDYVITAMPSQLESIFEFLGSENCVVIYLNVLNKLERRHRAIGEGDFRNLPYWTRETDESAQFEDLQFDLELDNKDKDTSKVITQIQSFIKNNGG
ncbi:MAG: hypothetical protein R3Y32_03610 [Bacillota bacterium]